MAGSLSHISLSLVEAVADSIGEAAAEQAAFFQAQRRLRYRRVIRSQWGAGAQAQRHRVPSVRLAAIHPSRRSRRVGAAVEVATPDLVLQLLAQLVAQVAGVQVRHRDLRQEAQV